jgi:hypothetical protein
MPAKNKKKSLIDISYYQPQSQACCDAGNAFI